jgi:hypothetical protein
MITFLVCYFWLLVALFGLNFWLKRRADRRFRELVAAELFKIQTERMKMIAEQLE